MGEKTCLFGGTGDEGGKQDQHPSCSPDGQIITWARETTGYAGSHDIYKILVDDFLNELPHRKQTIIDLPPYDETMPVWAPSGSQIAFASNRPWFGSTDYEIYAIMPNGNGLTNLTDNLYDDDEPNWGPGALP